MRRYINEGLTEFLGRAPVAWHMPGHKRKNKFFDNNNQIDIALNKLMQMDVTEVPGTDDLHDPEAMILDSMKELSRCYKSAGSFYMVNGATGGILSAIHAVKEYSRANKKLIIKGYQQGEIAGNENAIPGKILIARNCHKSVYNAVDILNLEVCFVEPEKYIYDAGALKPLSTDEHIIEGKQNPLRNNEHNTEEKQSPLRNDEYVLEKTLTPFRNDEYELEKTLTPFHNDGHKLKDYIAGHISAERVQEICEKENIFAMVLTSPTYEGVISDIKAISDILHKHGAILIVDEAHGAHLPFSDKFPKSAIACGADIVVQSLHKTLPAMTQTAIMHVMNEKLLAYVKDSLQIFMSSSPSYVMLCSMENAIAWAEEYDFTEYQENLQDFKKEVEKLNHLHIIDFGEVTTLGAYSYDDTRIVIVIKDGCTGKRFADILRDRFNIVVEMAGNNYCVLISTAADERSDFYHLAKTLKQIDENWSANVIDDSVASSPDTESEITKIKQLKGTISDRNLYVYPPGSYIVRQGEIVTEDMILELISKVKAGLRIRGL